jgi:colanic acid biosynthesis glycosyl transferase WcaI
MRRPLRILNHHIFYPPEAVGVAAYAGQMCEWLARQGHQVRVICPPPYYPYWAVQPPYKSWRYGVGNSRWRSRHALPHLDPRRSPGESRARSMPLASPSPSFPALLREMFRRPDVIFVTEPSFLNTVASLAAAKCCGALSWMHVQDFELDIAFDMGHFRSSWPRR